MFKLGIVLVALFATCATHAEECVSCKGDPRKAPGFWGADVVHFSRTGDVIVISESYNYVFEGRPYYFSTEANRTAFASNPASFLGRFQLEGLCAFSMAEGGVKIPGRLDLLTTVGADDLKVLYLNGTRDAYELFQEAPERVAAVAEWEHSRR